MYICILIRVHVYTYIDLYTQIHMNSHAHICVRENTKNVQRYICLLIHIYMYKTLHIRMQRYIYICIRIHTSKSTYVYRDIYSYTEIFLHLHTYIHIYIQRECVRGDTGWRRLIESPKLQIIFHKRATKYRSLLRKMTYKDKGSYESSPPCTKDMQKYIYLLMCVHIYRDTYLYTETHIDSHTHIYITYTCIFHIVLHTKKNKRVNIQYMYVYTCIHMYTRMYSHTVQ